METKTVSLATMKKKLSELKKKHKGKRGNVEINSLMKKIQAREKKDTKKTTTTSKKPAGSTSNWFMAMSPAAQKAYIKAHPNSKYAKGSKNRTQQLKATGGQRRLISAVNSKAIANLRDSIGVLQDDIAEYKKKKKLTAADKENLAEATKELKGAKSYLRKLISHGKKLAK